MKRKKLTPDEARYLKRLKAYKQTCMLAMEEYQATIRYNEHLIVLNNERIKTAAKENALANHEMNLTNEKIWRLSGEGKSMFRIKKKTK